MTTTSGPTQCPGRSSNALAVALAAYAAFTEKIRARVATVRRSQSSLLLRIRAAVIGIAMISTAVIGTAVIGTAVIGTAMIGTAMIGTAMIGTAVIGTAVIRTAVIRTAVIGTAMISTAVIRTAAVYAAITIRCIAGSAGVGPRVRGACLRTGAGAARPV